MSLLRILIARGISLEHSLNSSISTLKSSQNCWINMQKACRHVTVVKEHKKHRPQCGVLNQYFELLKLYILTARCHCFPHCKLCCPSPNETWWAHLSRSTRLHQFYRPNPTRILLPYRLQQDGMHFFLVAFIVFFSFNCGRKLTV